MYNPLDGTIIGGLLPASFIIPPRKTGRRIRSIFQLGRYRHNAFKRKFKRQSKKNSKVKYNSILPQIQTSCTEKRRHRIVRLLCALKLPLYDSDSASF